MNGKLELAELSTVKLKYSPAQPQLENEYTFDKNFADTVLWKVDDANKKYADTRYKCQSGRVALPIFHYKKSEIPPFKDTQSLNKIF